MVGPTPVLGTYDNRLRQTGSEVDIRGRRGKVLVDADVVVTQMPGKLREEFEPAER
jgi:hypothetical protein